MKIELIPIKDLKLDKKNARKHPERNLTGIRISLEMHGQQKPLVIDKNNTLIAGNGTLMAAKDLGWDKVACVRSELSGSKLRAYAIQDNQTTITGEWDKIQLTETLEELFKDGINLEALGFSQSDLSEALEDDDKPESKSKTKTCPHCGEVL
jgi:ParB-like chromosome segregation protein Spo0J